MRTSCIVEPFDVLDEAAPILLSHLELHALERLGLKTREELLNHHVVKTLLTSPIEPRIRHLAQSRQNTVQEQDKLWSE